MGDARRAAAPKLASAVRSHLTELALPRARIDVEVDGDAGDAVTYLLAANPGEDLAPLARVASGGELARTMLALRLVVTEAPPTLVFDEVDAGIGGQAALAVGRSLASLGATHQVLVVTHLAQVAAYADAQVAVDKREANGRTTVSASAVDGDARAGRAVTDAVRDAVERDRPRSRRGAARRRRTRARPLTLPPPPRRVFTLGALCRLQREHSRFGGSEEGAAPRERVVREEVVGAGDGAPLELVDPTRRRETSEAVAAQVHGAEIRDRLSTSAARLVGLQVAVPDSSASSSNLPPRPRNGSATSITSVPDRPYVRASKAPGVSSTRSQRWSSRRISRRRGSASIQRNGSSGMRIHASISSTRSMSSAYRHSGP